MKIAIDIDDVLSTTSKHFIEHINNKYNINYKFHQMRDYNFNWLENISPNEIFLFLEEKLEDYEIFENAKETIIQLKQEHELFILTSRKEAVKARTIIWLNTHFGENLFNEIIFINSTQTQNNCKGEVCVKNNFDILIEDAPHFAEKSSKMGIKVFLMDRPWNQNIKNGANLQRVKNWKEISQKLC